MKIRPLLTTISTGFDFFVKTFYHPPTYRDIAYRQEGYGIKSLLMATLMAMMVSYLMLGIKTYAQFERVEKPKILALPNFMIENKKLNNFNQSVQSTQLVNSRFFNWVSDYNLPNVLAAKADRRLILGERYLWMPYPEGPYLGDFFLSAAHYLPIISWAEFDGLVNGPILLAHNRPITLWFKLFCSALPYYAVNCFFIFLFIRLFGHIARNMVMLAMRESLEYKLTCRLLSATGIPTLVLMTMIIHYFGFHPATKFIFMGIYMFYFYLGLRFIKAKSYFRWIKN